MAILQTVLNTLSGGADQKPAATTVDVPRTRSSHPLDELSADEMSAVSLAVREHAAKEQLKALKFVSTALILPPKKAVLAYLGIPTTPGEKSEASVELKRRSEIDFLDAVTGDAWNATLTLNESTWSVDTLTKLASGTQPQITVEELLEAEEIIRKDPEVIRLAAEVGIKAEELCADGWSIGYDERFPQTQRLQQCLLYARLAPDDNIYAHPLDFFPVIDGTTCKVIHIDFAPHRSTTGELSSTTTAAPDLSASDYGITRERITPPKAAIEYLPDLMDEKEQERLKSPSNVRNDLKPLHIVQPEGVSFTMHGNEIEWQKWKMHISFNGREGLVLSTITYNDNGEIRPIMYRMSLAEMVVPYGAPEHPHGRKFAFDVGEYGMGAMANDLSLGCDCLGTIHYLPGDFISHSGKATHIKRAVCIHEEDAGLLWKHTDFRTGGRSISVRSRKLVISMIATVANYEYCFYYNIYQDGTIELETRLTGILNVYVAAPGEQTPYGTVVAPQIQGHYHQHIFSLRLDPMIDGIRNTLVETDIVPSEFPTGSKENYAGNAFGLKNEHVSIPGARDYNAETDRRWVIVNEDRKNPVNGRSVGYSIGGMRGAHVNLMAKPDSWIAKRATFAKHALWVVKSDEEKGRLFPAGKYVPQTRESPPDSVGGWVKEDEGSSVTNEDILLFLTFGVTHIPRPEDWPVMPVEHVRLTLKPNNFFHHSPALDVRAETDMNSKLAFGLGSTPEGGVAQRHIEGTNTDGANEECEHCA